MSRFKAFLYHLLGSAAVLAIIFTVMTQCWYPGRLFSTASGVDLLLLMGGVDLVVGPLFMLIIFDPKKRYLKLDIAVILLLQLSFMGYGLWTSFKTRPVYFVFAEDQFYLVKADQIEPKDLAMAKDPQFQGLPLLGPQWVGSIEPADLKERNNIVLASLAGMGIQNLPQYFIPYERVLAQVLKAGKTGNNIYVENAEKIRFAEFEREHSTQKVLFLRLINKNVHVFVAIDAVTGKFIALI